MQVGNPALYPPLLMLPVVPLSLLPWWLALSIWIVVGLASIAGALYLLDVRDVRCYVVALLCAPTVAGVTWGNATLLLVPLVALAWRWRHHTYRGGAMLGVAIAAKLFVWPLVFWLLGTRRYRAAAAATAAGVAAVIVPWAAIGFAGLASYPDLLRVAEGVYATHSFSVATMLNAIGVDGDLAPRGAVPPVLGWRQPRLHSDAVARTTSFESPFPSWPRSSIAPSAWPVLSRAVSASRSRSARPPFLGSVGNRGLFYLADRLPRPLAGAPRMPTAAGIPAASSGPRPPLQVVVHGQSSACWPPACIAYAASGNRLVLFIARCTSRRLPAA